MSRLLAFVATFAAGWAIARSVHGPSSRSAEAEAETPPVRPVRNAGPSQMRDPPPTWDAQDERSDESFPPSDPPGTY